jgi:hypothetical protein
MANLRLDGFDVQISRLFAVRDENDPHTILAIGEYTADDSFRILYGVIGEQVSMQLAPLLKSVFEAQDSLAPYCARLQSQITQLEKMLSAGSGESLADEACLFVGPDDVQCSNPATQLLIDKETGQRCPVCDEHYDSAPANLKVLAS